MAGHPGNGPAIENNNGFLEATGLFKGRVSVRVNQGLSQLTESIIFVAIPSTGVHEVLDELAGHELSNKMLIFITGNSAAIKAHMATNAKVILETATSPFSSRVTADGHVNFRGVKKFLKLSILASKMGQEDLAQVASLFPMPVEWCPSVLETFLSGLSGVVHVPTTLMNLGWMETTNGDFYFYRQGMSPSVCNIIEALDKERLAVAAAYKVPTKSVVEIFNANYGTNETTLRGFADKTVVHNSTKGAQKRFIDQDVPYWLVLCSELGLRAGVPTTTIDAMILFASILRGTDYRNTGTTLKSLGLDNATVEEVIKAFQGDNADEIHMQAKQAKLHGSAVF
ncbi:NAD/NADP octopine/nopaline dehydrogenase [Cordyceps javanica]|uniref:NAD/NADP octopine/nopaline dehydrogenase n=1 Tax=Cordyceps javanica TaxID=43265 RepID=A0A545V1J1_9HYPO|nr:NAD/NADP octopine/nopaline dehydrogenase [Cordyceps javanica]TQW07208.1 NAD/NADP octopine/nopaline dehydrogenase [Cordyceps javanica]